MFLTQYETYKSCMVLMDRPKWSNTGEIRRFKVEYLIWRFGRQARNIICMPGPAQKRAITEILAPLCTGKYTLIACIMWSQNCYWGAFGDFIKAFVNRGSSSFARVSRESNCHHVWHVDTRSINLKPIYIYTLPAHQNHAEFDGTP